MRKIKSYITYKSHIEFLDYVNKLHQQNPKAIRLDLKTLDDKRTGNRDIAGIFFYPEKMEHQQNRSYWVKWKVHSDTMFSPLVEAQKLIDKGIYFPFKSGRTNTNKGIKLKLVGSVKIPGLNIYKIK